jgi:hypothetical protein
VAGQYFYSINYDFLPLSGGTVTGATYIQSNLSANTFYSGSTDISDLISSQEIYVTGGTYNSGTTTIDFYGKNGFTPFNVDVSALLDDTNTYITDITYDNVNKITASRNDGTVFETFIDVISGATFYGNGSGITDVQISNVTNLQTELNSKVENGINVGGQTEVFSGKSGSNLYFKTLSGGSNTTLIEQGDIITIDVSVPVDTNTFVTGGTYDESEGKITLLRNDSNSVDITGLTGTYVTAFTYNNLNSFNISLSDGTTFDAPINNLSATTISATTFYGDGSNLVGIVPELSDGQIFVGDSGNTAQAVSMYGDALLQNDGFIEIQSEAVTYDKMQRVSEEAILGSLQLSGGIVEEIPILDQYEIPSSAQTQLNLEDNWDINGNYTGSTLIDSTFQGQSHYNNNYFFTAVDDNIWIRLIRG